jgi:hypothetical protein
MNFSKILKYVIIVCTKTHPKRGISAWKKAKTPAIDRDLVFFIFGSLSPLAIDTEKASMASPTPKNKLLTINSIIKKFPLSSINGAEANTSAPHI